MIPIANFLVIFCKQTNWTCLKIQTAASHSISSFIQETSTMARLDWRILLLNPLQQERSPRVWHFMLGWWSNWERFFQLKISPLHLTTKSSSFDCKVDKEHKLSLITLIFKYKGNENALSYFKIVFHSNENVSDVTTSANTNHHAPTNKCIKLNWPESFSFFGDLASLSSVCS